ncbi:MAG: serine hydrolase [Bacteroidota bacterium]
MKISSLFSVAILLFSQFLFAQTDNSDPLRPPLADLPTVDPASVGLDGDAIQASLWMVDAEPSTDLRGVVVIKDGKLVVEEYYNTFWRGNIHDIRSAGKSITAVLMGIAIHQGLVKSVDESVYSFFPPEKYSYRATEAHRNIKIKHLLTMSTGMDADTDDWESPGNAGQWIARGDWLRYVLNLPMKFTSGERWVYNDAAALLTGAIIEETSGMSLAAFAEKNLFGPLGIEEYYWLSDATGRTGGMGNLYIGALDFAKIGLLVLNEGTWQEERLLSKDYITALSKEQIYDPNNGSYGYMWYLDEATIGNKTYPVFYASGNGGNRLFVIPEEDLVVSVQSSAYGYRYGHRRAWNIMRMVLLASQK